MVEPNDIVGKGITLAECLALPALAEARPLAETDMDRRVIWVSIIEWPVDQFVSPGDLVLTTGLGCDEDQLCIFVEECAAAGATAIIFGVGQDAPITAVPSSVTKHARDGGIGLWMVPWRVRFSDVSRGVISVLYSEHDLVRPTGSLPIEFTRALLDSGGVTSVAEALEGVLNAPALVLDEAMNVLGASPAGEDWIDTADHRLELAAVVKDLLRKLPGTQDDGVYRTNVEAGEILVAPALGQGRILGWIVTVAQAQNVVAKRATLHAATAVAIELLRQAAAFESESRARGQFIWAVAAGEFTSPYDLAARSALLGLPLNAQFTIGLGLFESPNDPAASTRAQARELARRLRIHVQATSVVAPRESEVLLCLQHGDRDVHVLFEDPALTPFTNQISWGFANGEHSLSELPQAVAQARTALAVTRALRGPGAVATAEQLGSFMLLHAVASDPVAVHLAQNTLRALEEADSNRKSDLLGTLAVLLDENGNISSAARRLHLNRHSLMYRVGLIEKLTQRNLELHEDRLMLDLSMRIRRLHAPLVALSSQPHPRR